MKLMDAGWLQVNKETATAERELQGEQQDDKELFDELGL